MAHSGSRTMQISLRSLLLLALVAGLLAGTYGPKVAQAIRNWHRPTPIPVQDLDLESAPSSSSADTGYFGIGGIAVAVARIQ